MTQTDGPLGGPPVDEAVHRAREQFDDAVELLRATKDKLKRGEVAGVRDVASQVALVLKTLMALGEARGKIDELAHGRIGGYVLDLDAARREVGSRLDRLRAGGGA